MKQRAGVTDPPNSIGAAAIRFGGLAGAARLLFARDARTARWAAAAGAAIVICLGIPLAALLNIWIDEAFTLHTTGRGPFVAWTQAVSFETQPPLYFFLIGLWRWANEGSILFARLPSVLFAAAGVAAVVAAAWRAAPRVPPAAVALTTAFNPLVIWAAVEMRVYPLVFLIGAALAWTFIEGFLRDSPPRWARIAYVGFAIAGLYTQFYVGFFLLANLLTLGAVRRDALRAFVVCGAAITAAFLPFVPAAIGQVAQGGGFVQKANPLHAVHEVFNAVYTTVLPHAADYGPTRYATLALSLLLAVALVAFGRPKIGADPVARGVIVLWALCLVIFCLVFIVTGLPYSVPTHAIVMAPISLLAAFVVLSGLTRHAAVAGLAAAGVYTLFTCVTLGIIYHPPLYKSGEWQRVAAAIGPDAATVPVAVFPAESQLVLDWYLPAAVIPIPRPMPFTSDYVAATTLTSVNDVARVLDPVSARAERLWVVSTDCSGNVLRIYNYHCEYLEAYLAARYRLVKSLAFRGSDARLFERVDAAAGNPR